MKPFQLGTSLSREAQTLFTSPTTHPRWIFLGLAFLSLTQLSCAKLSVRIEEVEFTLGQNITIKWEGGREPVLIQLLYKNDQDAFIPESNITANGKGDDQLEWETPKDMKPGTYSISGTDSGGPAPSFPFNVQEDSKTVSVSVQPSNVESADTPSESASASASASQPTSTTTDPPPSAKPPTSGLRTSAKAGIGIGVSVSGLTMVILAATFLGRRRERNFEEEESLYSPQHHQHHPHSPRSLSPTSQRSATPPVISPLTPPIISPLTPSKSPNRGLLFHFPRSFTPKLGKPFSLNALLSPSTTKSAKTLWLGERAAASSPLSDEQEKRRKALVVGPPLTELPAVDVDIEVLNRHEMPTKANTPELPGSPGERFSGRGRRVHFSEENRS